MKFKFISIVLLAALVGAIALGGPVSAASAGIPTSTGSYPATCDYQRWTPGPAACGGQTWTISIAQGCADAQLHNPGWWASDPVCKALIAKVTAVRQPTCASAYPTASVWIAGQASVGFAATKTSARTWAGRSLFAKTVPVKFPALRRGASSSYFIVVSLWDDKAPLIWFGPYRFHRLTNTQCLVRAYQPSATVANPKAYVHLEAAGSVGYAKSCSGTIYGVKSGNPNWYWITFPAQSRWSSTVWYLVVRTKLHPNQRLCLGPLLDYRH